MSIVNKQLTTTQLDLVTVPSNKIYGVTSILICNTYSQKSNNPDQHQSSFDMYIIKNGDSLEIKKNTVIREWVLPAGESMTVDTEKIVLEEGDKISFVAEPDQGSSLTDLAATISYFEY